MTPHEKACLKIEAVMQWPIAAGFALSSHDAYKILHTINQILEVLRHERLPDETWEKEKGAPQPGGEKPVAQLAPYNF